MLVKVGHDIKDINDLLDHVTSLLMAINGSNDVGDDMQLPEDLQLPLESIKSMESMENAMMDNNFRKRMVCKICMSNP